MHWRQQREDIDKLKLMQENTIKRTEWEEKQRKRKEDQLLIDEHFR